MTYHHRDAADPQATRLDAAWVADVLAVVAHRLGTPASTLATPAAGSELADAAAAVCAGADTAVGRVGAVDDRYALRLLVESAHCEAERENDAALFTEDPRAWLLMFASGYLAPGAGEAQQRTSRGLAREMLGVPPPPSDLHPVYSALAWMAEGWVDHADIQGGLPLSSMQLPSGPAHDSIIWMVEQVVAEFTWQGASTPWGLAGWLAAPVDRPRWQRAVESRRYDLACKAARGAVLRHLGDELPYGMLEVSARLSSDEQPVPALWFGHWRRAVDAPVRPLVAGIVAEACNSLGTVSWLPRAADGVVPGDTLGLVERALRHSPVQLGRLPGSAPPAN